MVMAERPGTEHRVDILMEEYRVLYTLITLRLTSLDRRVPLAGASLAAFLGSVTVLPRDAQLVFLFGLPVALVWFLRATVNHARSAEDLLRRIEEIEREINRLCGEELLAFQSRHPSRGRQVGGRTATESVKAVFCSCALVLAACMYLAWTTSGESIGHLQAYAGYVAGVAIYLVGCVLTLGRYRYRKQGYGGRILDLDGRPMRQSVAGPPE